MDEGLTDDLVALWRSELTAMAADRELREGFVSLIAAWAAVMAAAGIHDATAGGAWPVQPPRAAAPAAASGAGRGAAESRGGDDADSKIDRLGRRIAELERRLGQLEGGDG